MRQENNITVPNHKVTAERFLSVSINTQSLTGELSLQPELLVTELLLLGLCTTSTRAVTSCICPLLLLFVDQKLLEKSHVSDSNFMFQSTAGEQRQPFLAYATAHRPAQNWFYQLFTFSTTIPATTWQNNCFPFRTGVE